jgi:hypothetical protein
LTYIYILQRPFHLAVNREHDTVNVSSLLYPDAHFFMTANEPTIHYYDMLCAQNGTNLNENIHPIPAHETDPIMYHYTPHNGRMNTRFKFAHVFPNKLAGVNLIGIQLWLTRCSRPRIDLIVFDLDKNKIRHCKTCTKMLTKSACDLEFVIEDTKMNEIMT